MGPNIIFDKSALEMLSIDESCWLDAFFSSNITPIFFAESLADLEKIPKSGTSSRDSFDIVAELAEKTPSASSYPNIYHHTLIINDLLGNPINMSNRVLVSGGQAKKTPDGRIGVHYEQFPEAEALGRWQKREFSITESIVAKYWRNGLSNLDFDPYISWVKNIIPSGKKFRSLEEIKGFLDMFVKNKGKEIFDLACFIFNYEGEVKEAILKRQRLENKSFEEFAPYASFCLKVDLFFYLALYFSLIAKERPSNRIDMSYLYYLPFCMVFVSNDKLHNKTAPLFMEMGQTFVSGADFKKALGILDDYYSKLPDEVKSQGIMSFAQYPPVDIDNLVSKLWDEYMSPKWKGMKKTNENKVRDIENDKKVVKKITTDEQESVPIPDKVKSDEVDYITMSHMVPPYKGKWQLFSQEVIDNHKDSKA